MKVRKVLDKKVGKTSYYKYLLTLPKKIIEEGNFDGSEVKVTLKGGGIFIEKQDSSIKKKKLTREEKAFRNELLKIIK